MNESEMPDNSFIHFSLTAKGTTVGVGFETLCPNFSSHENPSPVEPVSGWDIPPVAKIKLCALYSCPRDTTAVILFPCASTRDTGELVLTVTFPLFIYFSSAKYTSQAFWVFGNARFLASTISCRPNFSKKENVSFTPNWAKAEYKNCSPLP